MAEAISAVASVQLTVLQAPEVARRENPAVQYAALANAQAASSAAQQRRLALETVRQTPEADRRGVPSDVDGAGDRGLWFWGQGGRGRLRGRLQHLAAAHPGGVGLLVDVRA